MIHDACARLTSFALIAALGGSVAVAQSDGGSAADGGDVAWNAPLKDIPVGEEGKLSFGGAVQSRYEYWSNFGFAEQNDDGFLLTRVLLNADLRFNEAHRAFVELKSVVATDRDLPGGQRTLDVDTFDIQNAYYQLDFDGDDLDASIRIGRQPLKFGKQRLISPLPWANNLRSFDGGRVTLKFSGWTVDGFYTRLVTSKQYEFNDWSRGFDLFGVYATRRFGEGDKSALDLYWIGIDRDRAAFNGTAGEEDRHTFGARIAPRFFDGRFGLDIEGAYQTGELDDRDISAYFFAAEADWVVVPDGWRPTLRAGFDYASGDDDAGGDVETFNQLVPLGHAFFGYADVIGRQNIIDASAGVSVTPVERLKVALDFHAFWRASEDDALYNAGGGVVRPGTASGSEVGQEIDLTVKYTFNDYLNAQVGVSHVFSGDFIERSGPDEDITFAYAQLQFVF